MKIHKLFLALPFLFLATTAGFADNKEGSAGADQAKVADDALKQQRYEERHKEKLAMSQESDEHKKAREAREKAHKERRSKRGKKPEKSAPQMVQESARPVQAPKHVAPPDSGRVMRKDVESRQAHEKKAPENNPNPSPTQAAPIDNQGGGGTG